MVKVLSFINHVAAAPEIEKSIAQAFEWGVDYIISQGTGMDWGPHYFGSGEHIDINNFRENVRPYLRAARQYDVPFIMSVGVAGGTPQLEMCLEAIESVSSEDGWDARVAVFDTELEKETLKAMLRSGVRPKPMGEDRLLAVNLKESDVDESVRIVSLMGPEPIQQALAENFDGVITGRALDTGLFMAPLLNAGVSKGIAAHAGKVLECGGVALENGTPGACIWADVAVDSFEVRSPSPKHLVSATSLSAHSFYERANPWKEENPGGYLDLGNVSYESTELGVRCSGAKWVNEPYSVVIEGVKKLGERAISILGVRDPAYLSVLPGVEEATREAARTASGLTQYQYGEDYEINLRVYGLNAVLGDYEPNDEVTGHEASIVLDVVGKTQEIANEVCWVAFMFLYYHPYEGRKTTAGNSASPFMPAVVPLGDVYAFNIYHILPLEDPVGIYPFSIQEFEGSKALEGAH